MVEPSCDQVPRFTSLAGSVKLFVVARAEGVSLEELKAYCKTNFTGYKVPKHIVLRDSLPMTPVGKILRRELRDIA